MRQYGRAVAYFAVRLTYGPHWDASRPIREQDGWDEHASFMDGLVDDGFVLLGGPLGDGAQVLLVVEATDADEIEARMGEDPWTPKGLRRIASIEPWSVWLDGRRHSRTG